MKIRRLPLSLQNRSIITCSTVTSSRHSCFYFLRRPTLDRTIPFADRFITLPYDDIYPDNGCQCAVRKRTSLNKASLQDTSIRIDVFLLMTFGQPFQGCTIQHEFLCDLALAFCAAVLMRYLTTRALYTT
jgi:hypothetical protein